MVQTVIKENVGKKGNDLPENTETALPKLYKPNEVEPKWQEYWRRPEVYKEAYMFDKSDENRPVFVIDTPPPFTSGELHTGHAYWNIINDTVARYMRMRGYNVLLPQGWDCQGLPTELKVQNIWKVPRDDKALFRSKCKEWTEKMIASMKGTMMKLGYRPDWEQFEYRTMDASYWKNVQSTLLEFYEKSLIYRSEFPVHWCPKCETALAQAELGYVEEEGLLHYVKFLHEDTSLEVATTRPEMLPACHALAVHPEDYRYSKFIGKKAKIPLFEREIPILSDPDVDPAFGTGIVMICTFGDEQDIRWYQKYRLPMSKIIDEKGRMINAGKYDGLSILKARKTIVSDLKEAGLLSKEERLTHKILCHTERPDCMSPIEFLAKKQWLIKIIPFKNDVLKACKEMRWTPGYMLQRLIDWTESIEWNWVISRQRIYGTPIPFWQCSDCNAIIPAKDEQLPVDTSKEKPPVEKCPSCDSKNFVGTEDVCDCWIDSSITPLVISGYFDRESSFARTYPSTIRQQGHDIIRTWLFYTVMRCLILTGWPPFKDVLINGHILGPDGHRMSKSKGNVISPEDHLDEYGADSLRQALLSLTIGSDFAFRWETVKYGKSFLQKYWSASRFAQPFLENYKPSQDDATRLNLMDKWILARLAGAVEKITEALDGWQFHLAVETVQNFFWHDFCDQYLEAVKSRLYAEEEGRDKKAAMFTLYTVLLNTTLMLAPICPHITEEVFAHLFRMKDLSTVHAMKWPEVKKLPLDKEAEAKGAVFVEAMSKIRGEKAKAGIPLSAQLDSVIIRAPEQVLQAIMAMERDLKQILRIKNLQYEKNESVEVKIKRS